MAIVNDYEQFIFDYNDAIFEWDDEKDIINFKKHGIKFKTAQKIFADSNKIVRLDKEHSYDEDRYDVIGKIGKVLFVVCVFRDKNVVRIISARQATAKEKARYEYGNC